MKKIFLVFLFAVLFSSCKKEDPVVFPEDDPAPQPIGDMYPQNNSVQIKSNDLGKINTFTSSSITFSDDSPLKNINSGSVIFSEGYLSTKAPKGFLRKVTSISANTLYTSSASIEDAFSKGDLDFTIFPSSLQKVTVTGVSEKSTSTQNKTYNLDYLIYDQDNNSQTRNDQLRLEGYLKLDGSITGGIHFPPFKVDVNFSFTNELDLNLIATGGLNYTTQKTLFIAKGTPLVVSGVVLTPELIVKFIPQVSVEGEATTGINDKISLNSSLSFDEGWKLNNSFRNTFTAKPVEIELNGKLKGTLSFGFSVYLYELVGPGAEVGPYLEFDADIDEDPWWKLYAGAQGSLTINTKGIASLIGNYSYQLFDSRKLITQAQNSPENKPPTAIFYITPSSGTTETNFEFSARSSIDLETSQSELVCRWDFEGDGNWETDYQSINTLAYHQYSVSNYYYPTLEVKDGGGLTDTLDRILNVSSVQSVITPASNPDPADGATVPLIDPFQLKWDYSTHIQGKTIYYEAYIGRTGDSFTKVITSPDWTMNFVYAQIYVFEEGMFYWKVRSFDSDGNEAWSPVWSFTTEISVEEPQFSTFTDSRDGRVYKTVKIGDQWWFAENLDYYTDISRYYNDDSLTYHEYGRLYTWEDAKNSCPSGWHLPSLQEWEVMINFIGGYNVAGGKLKETGYSHWKSPNTGATNEYGFSAIGAGYLFKQPSGNLAFHRINEWGDFWTSSKPSNDPFSAFDIIIHYDEAKIFGVSSDGIDPNGYFSMESVRPIKD